MRIPALLLVPTLLLMPWALVPVDDARESAPDPAPQEPAAEAHEHGDHEHDDDSPLHEIMEELGDHQKRLRKLLGGEGDRAEMFQVLHEMQTLALKAATLPPEPWEEMSDDDRILWRIAFQRRILDVVDHLLRIERAVVLGEADEARGLYREMISIKKKGHDTFIPPDEDED